jgi:hypothetical protein
MTIDGHSPYDLAFSLGESASCIHSLSVDNDDTVSFHYWVKEHTGPANKFKEYVDTA